jgi:CheY-like chemotaxis protein
MNQITRIRSIEAPGHPSPLDGDALTHKAGLRLVPFGVAYPGSKQVLLAEVEPLIRNLMHRLLDSWGYRVLSAGNGREAMELADGHKGPIDLLVSDVHMPEMDGPELAKKLKAKRPKLQVILLSGYSQTDIVIQPGWTFIQKPFQLQELSAAIAVSLGSQTGAI